MLLNMIAMATAHDEGYLRELAALHEKHASAATEILSGALLSGYLAALEEDVANLKAMLRAIAIAGVSAGGFADFVVGHGELWCARLFVASLQLQGAAAVFCDTRDVLTVTDASDGGVDVSYDVSNAALDAWWAAAAPGSAPPIVVATGFIARTPEGVPTTLRRNGSDYSATIMGALTRAGGITIWTDVDGVYSADPRKVSEAVCLDALSYNEAWELSYFGANVLHPRTTLPAMKFGIPIQIRNFFNLTAPGTRIADTVQVPGTATSVRPPANQLVKGFATIENVTLINVEGTGMVGVPGTASNIFACVRDAGVNVIMISQASSEHSVCFACQGAQAAKAVAALEARFENAIAAGRLSRVTTIPNCSILAAVGQQMASTYGVCAMLFEALAKSAINVRAIAQGCSEYNITAVIDGADTERALRAVHSRFYLSETPIAVGIVGPGAIGKTLLAQLREQLPVLHSEFNVDVRVAGVADSKRMLLAPGGVDLATWEADFAAAAPGADLSAFAKALKGSFIPNVCIIDCSASEKVASYYEEWMRQGIHVITPNKRANSGPFEYWARLRELGRKSYTHYFYEATVGAGLPILSTLQSLRDSGDRILRIEGVFSGTLSYIFNTFAAGGAPFSQVVAEAKRLGYTEPDPRDDLSGTDVARKVVILAREAGLRLELADVPVQSLVPAALQGVASAEEYMRRLPEHDADMAALIAAADAAGEVLRYVGIVDPGPEGTGPCLRSEVGVRCVCAAR
jgi:aspartokinase/homoserine dehydrogenase 1